MSRVPYTNTTNTGHYVGNVFVPANGTRTVDGRLLPPASAAPAAAPDDPLKLLASGPVKDVVAALPTLDAASCDALLEIERANKNRPSAVEAIELRKLEIVDAAEQEELARKAAEEAAAAAAKE